MTKIPIRMIFLTKKNEKITNKNVRTFIHNEIKIVIYQNELAKKLIYIDTSDFELDDREGNEHLYNNNQVIKYSTNSFIKRLNDDEELINKVRRLINKQYNDEMKWWISKIILTKNKIKYKEYVKIYNTKERLMEKYLRIISK